MPLSLFSLSLSSLFSLSFPSLSLSPSLSYTYVHIHMSIYMCLYTYILQRGGGLCIHIILLDYTIYLAIWFWPSGMPIQTSSTSSTSSNCIFAVKGPNFLRAFPRLRNIPPSSQYGPYLSCRHSTPSRRVSECPLFSLPHIPTCEHVHGTCLPTFPEPSLI